MTISKEQFQMKKVFTAADYIQDNLVMMWDGIENAGRGIHDSNAPQWTEWVSQKLMPSNRYVPIFDSNSMNGYASNVPIDQRFYYATQAVSVDQDVIDALNSGEFTVEFFFSIMKNKMLYTPVFTFYSDNVIGIYRYNMQYGWCIGGTDINNMLFKWNMVENGNYYIMHTTFTASSGNFTAIDHSTNDIKRNVFPKFDIKSTYCATYPSNTDLKLPNDLHVYAMRFYSKALTEDEATMNADIDKRRFGI